MQTLRDMEGTPMVSSQKPSRILSKILSCAALLATTSGGAIVLPTYAVAQAQVSEGGKARVSRSGSLRSLTEVVASASCRLNGQIDPAQSQADLAKAKDDFSAIISGLINGNPLLGMPGAERSPRMLSSLEATANLWAPLEAAAERLVAGTGSAADADLILSSHATLFSQTEQTAADVAGRYADPQALLQSDATVINFAIRQLALAHRMTRTMCELATGTGSDATVQELTETVDFFDRTLIALRDGFPAAGINPPPTDTISESLNETYSLWRANRAIYDNAIGGGQPSAADVASSAALTAELSVAMTNVVTLYLIATSGQDDVYRVPLEAYARGELASWMTDPDIIAAIKAQNIAHEGLDEPAIIELDLQWRAEVDEGGGPLINELLTRDVSDWLLAKQDATAGFVTEVFVMDNKGLNVAQSVVTSDYWQGDEAKWQETFLIGPDVLHISEVEFADSTGFYQSQASLSITDPATGEVIGAVTFGINIQNLM
ncbi:type IV pili methyl-accepting chemotaxis transducer N-terminal domain-containing protein [Yoonia sp.]|uniref:type IV pili methyl-accepting chemotaxis transducer N-terminal domain-containing protein n=1 Tax=Yoonia sp. TaxID=2212373 RepID=UPI002FD98194